jgi:hypothetical protein
MLLLVRQVTEHKWSDTALELLTTVNQVDSSAFFRDLPRETLVEFVILLNQILTQQMVSAHIKQEFFEQAVFMMNSLYQANQKRAKDDQIEETEFVNEAVNSGLDLQPLAQEWARKKSIELRNGLEPGNDDFVLFDFVWLFSTQTRASILSEAHKMEQRIQQDKLKLVSCFEKSIHAERYEMKVSRENLVPDSLAKLVKLPQISAGYDQLKLPLRIWFANEAGLDEGGLTREYLTLTIKEIFGVKGLFKYNEAVEMYWLRSSTEDLAMMELVGNLIGVAIYNDQQIDMPLVPVLFKILLGQKPDLNDLY